MSSVRSKEVLDSFQKLNRVIKRRSALVSPDNYGRSQGRVLRIIAAHNGINARDLANILEIKPPSLTVKLNKLEAEGYIMRRRDESDGRFVYIHIQPKGYEAISRRDEEKKNIRRDFTDCLTDEEKQQFCNYCERLSVNLAEILDEEVRRQSEERLARRSVQNFLDEDF